jgi:hypothetical protein
MRDVDILRQLHHALRPRTYLQLGSRQPERIELAACATVLVDREPELPQDALAEKPWLKYYATTSDAFFADERPEDVFDGQPVDLAIIDGVLSLNQLVRDLHEIERWSHERTIAAVFVENGREALLSHYAALARMHRPDLRVHRVASDPAPVLLVTAFDPNSNADADLAAAAAHGVVSADPIEIEPPLPLSAALPSHVLGPVSIACRVEAGSW